MPIGDSWGTYKTPCPNCNGEVEYWFFGADCRGNDASGGIQCKGCKRAFTSAEWNLIARDEMRERARQYWFHECSSVVLQISEMLRSNPNLANELGEDLDSDKIPQHSLKHREQARMDLHSALLRYGDYYKRLQEIK